MHTCGALALRSPSSWKPARDGRPCPASAPFLEPPRRCAQPPFLRLLPDQWLSILVLIVMFPPAPDCRSRQIPRNSQL
eukprot:2428966-Pleurochrysis_carterae.AAC.1